MSDEMKTLLEVLPSGIDAEDMGFLAQLLEVAVGGLPVMGYKPEDKVGPGLFVVVPTCPCEKCKPFNDQYVVDPRTTALQAARSYVKTRSEYNRAHLVAPEGVTKH